MIASRNFNIFKINTARNFYRAYSSSTLIKENKVKVDKWNVNYVKVGNGPHHVLCMPGALGTIWTSFKPQIEGFDREKFTLIAWDPPGYGKSRPPNKEFTADYHHKDAYYAFEFMRALNIPKYSVIGWSDGGIAALILAAKYPEAVMKLVGIAAAAFYFPEHLETTKNIRDISTWSDQMRQPLEEVYGDDLPKYWSDWVDGIETIYKVDNGNICAHLLKDIKCPTFILYGEKDFISPPAASLYLLKHLPQSRPYVYPDGKHNFHIRYADDFNKRVQDFLLQP